MSNEEIKKEVKEEENEENMKLEIKSSGDKKYKKEIKRKDRVYLYMLTEKREDGDYSQVKPLYFTAHIEEMYYVIELLFYKKHEEHYKSWCALRNLEAKKPEREKISESWDKYILDVYDGTIEDDYVILKMLYSLDDIAEVMRVMTGTEEVEERSQGGRETR